MLPLTQSGAAELRALEEERQADAPGLTVPSDLAPVFEP